jgi:hypothetical protein
MFDRAKIVYHIDWETFSGGKIDRFCCRVRYPDSHYLEDQKRGFGTKPLHISLIKEGYQCNPCTIENVKHDVASFIGNERIQ